MLRLTLRWEGGRLVRIEREARKLPSANTERKSVLHTLCGRDVRARSIHRAFCSRCTSTFPRRNYQVSTKVRSQKLEQALRHHATGRAQLVASQLFALKSNVPEVLK